MAGQTNITALTRIPSSSEVLSIDFQAWKEKFNKFIEESTYQPKLLGKKRSQENNPDASKETQPERFAEEHKPILPIEEISRRWENFLLSLEEKGNGLLASNLKVCEIKALKGRELTLLCSKEFAFEMLSGELARLSEAMQNFFQTPIYANLTIDKELVKATTEKSPYELFQELAKKNKLIKYLVDEFGAELIY
ncbi:hypothetical protein Ctha_0143 [Chloroherpeton thalassium ATCC 35110]|uniref:Uncharacterized protein n=1 Tax=Chloroherpeton thalassium (strain ATCC 35110 / GB-78) TaxID=517418 RepID=B3QSX1_CHLT3|nr:hypothetical protein [Chloroherpeton thalassium]ACF12614.1 hypothetical protein Ctha_0143 [Chloroherpeton thalassium ATCC 35110]